MQYSKNIHRKEKVAREIPVKRSVKRSTAFLDLSFQSAQRVMSTDRDAALDVLQDLSQNLPSKARYPMQIYFTSSFVVDTRLHAQFLTVFFSS